MYSRGEDTLKVSYEICVGGEWHDETPNINVILSIVRIKRAALISVRLKTAKHCLV